MLLSDVRGSGYKRAVRHHWAVLLAGGDGVRLRDLTVRIVGDERPKQFCPLVGAETLLRQTRSRIDPLFRADRQVFVVSHAHESYYADELADAAASKVIAQPSNRGTAVAMVVALIEIMRSDPAAVIAFFPCDHHFTDDELFRSTVSSAVQSAEQFPRSLVVVGAEAAYAETEYGWIEPGRAVTGGGRLCQVTRFWEKPALTQARALFRNACLWNTFITVGKAATFVELLCSEIPEVVISVTKAIFGKELAPVYEQLRSVDFSRDILARHATRLLVLRDSGSGWADLGSPARVLHLIANNVIQPGWISAAH